MPGAFPFNPTHAAPPNNASAGSVSRFAPSEHDPIVGLLQGSFDVHAMRQAK